MKKRIAIILAVSAALVIAGLFCFPKKNPRTAEIRAHQFKLDLAASGQERKKGLSQRDNLCQECGMLFIFPEKGIYSFWMKDMKFDLDIIWINNGKIAYIAKNVAFNDQRSINPGKLADKVLEINAGLSDRYGLEEGDNVNFSY